MENIKKFRAPLRCSFSRTANQLEQFMTSTDIDEEELTIMFSQLNDKWKKLESCDKELIDLLLQDTECTESDFSKEYESIETYSEKFVALKTKVDRLLHKLQTNFAKTVAIENCRKYKLPKIELKQFSGDILEWIGFWGQFKKIDEDPEIDAEDKFQYLLQSTVENSKARDIVQSFPPSGKNYKHAIEHLKSRFGKDDILVEVYVRELLRLVLNNAVNPEKRINLLKLYDSIETHLRALETLGVTSDKYASMLYPLVEACLPEDVLRTWERNHTLLIEKDRNEISKLELLMKFLRSEVEGEERISLVRQGFGFEKQRRNAASKPTYKENIPTASGLFSSKKKQENAAIKILCVYCKDKHYLEDCNAFGRISLDEKNTFLSNQGCCFICLKIGHTARMCKKFVRCPQCSKRHRLVMSPGTNASKQQMILKSDQTGNENNAVLSNRSCTEDVLMQTLKIRLCGPKEEFTIRGLIDTGSQKSYLKISTAEKIGYEPIGEETVKHTLFGGVESTETHKKYRVNLRSYCGSYKCNFEVYDQGKICSEVSQIKKGSWIEELKKKNIFLSDLQMGNEKYNDEIQLLIGADIAGKLLTGAIFHLSNGLVAIETRLGWTLMGKVPSDRPYSDTHSVLTLFSEGKKMSDLWSLDVLGITDPSEKQSNKELEEATKEHFCRNLKINDEGRYEVCLPWVRDSAELPNNLSIASKRLHSTVKNLTKNGILSAYEEVFNDWLTEDIIEPVNDVNLDAENSHYLPHRAVVKASSTTKIRPVFDASAKVKGNLSLNDCLEKGPNLIKLIPSILNRFRLRKYGVTADIRKAFLQISLDIKDRDFLRFLWWEEGDPEKLKVYRHKRVVFGLSSSPFLLAATLEHHLENSPEHLQNVSQKLKESMYVDNCVTSLDTREELNDFIQKSREIMLSGKFDLRGWVSNYPPSQEITSETEQKIEDLTAENKYLVPVLGVLWNIKEDTLICDIKDLGKLSDQPITKRLILSVANKIFDPIGFLTPLTLIPKVILQECWKEKFSWDVELPENISKRFRNWTTKICAANAVSIPRIIMAQRDSQSELSFHVFCDASMLAYATCVYLRTKNESGIFCNLVQARSRVAPLKAVTISRLELLACCIGTRLVNSIKKDFHFEHVPTYYWSDSMNAIYWIKNQENWATFVMNRVKEIRFLSDINDWNHIPGNLNPADLPSRGCSPDVLMKKRWWEGPQWLYLNEKEWPKSEISPNSEVINSEIRKTVVIGTKMNLKRDQFYLRFSTYPRILRVTAWIYRFFTNTKDRESRNQGELSVKELKRAEEVLMKLVQKEDFPNGIDDKIRQLHPVLDEKEIIRVKTKIFHRKDKKNFRCPILLPTDHYIVQKLIMWKHQDLHHAGTQILMNNLRENYWILRCRKTIKKILNQCVRCKRFKVTSFDAESPPLPEDRVRDASIFEITGVDLAGPLYLKEGQKSWVVLFTCAVYRAIHLELTTSLTTGAFFQTLRRFIARRGRPHVMYSDNGTNFTGASNALSELDWNKLLDEVNLKNITWKFIPPASPWWGGWWERLVSMIKNCLRKVIGQASLNYEELTTVLCEVESLINSRPLTSLTDDAEELIPLTPDMFLHEIKEVGVIDIDVIDKIKLRKRYAYLQKIKNDLRRRFRSEYLGQLKYSSKKKKLESTISVGEIVLVGSENQKRLQWPMARILEVYPGKDGIVRVAKIKTKHGIIIRPIQRLYPLELNQDEGIVLRKKKQFKKDKINELKSSNQPRIVVPEVTVTRSGRNVRKPRRLNL